MNENAEKLQELKLDLERLARDNQEALTLEPTIARPLYQALDEARRRFLNVTEAHAKREP